MPKKSNTKEFIEKSKKVHGDKYNYLLVDYVKSNIKVNIICLEHGIFEQTPSNHLSNHGCPMCNKIKIKPQNKPMIVEEFIEKSKKVHGDKYDYSLVYYKNAHIKIKIKCEKHGIFEQVPNSHLRGNGCPICNKIKIKPQYKPMGISKFIEKSKKVHGDKYDYSLVEYINCKTKVKIMCKKHGIFEQIPDHHHRGVGCPQCSRTYGGKFNSRYLYIFYDNEYNMMKIGVSNNPEKRLKEISKGKNRNYLKILKTYKKMAKIENHLHKHYEQFNIKHPIYEDGTTEWFNLSENELINIDNIIKSYKQDNQ